MCGIIGYLGQVPPVKNLLNSFLVLSSRGYDSFGFVSKKVFKETNVSDEVFKKSLNKSILNNCFLGHTRWATHGEVNKDNAHPIKTGNFYVVMNGQILNYDFLKKGKNLKSECDTELISYLLNEKLKDEKNITNQKLKKTIKEIIKKLEGDFSFAVKYFDKIILYKRKNPLYLSFEKNNFYFSSDFRIANSLSSKVKKNYILKDEEILILDSNSSFKNLDSNLIKKKSNIKKIVPKKSKYYTKLEILRQGNFDKMFNLKNFKFIKEVRKNIKRYDFFRGRFLL